MIAAAVLLGTSAMQSCSKNENAAPTQTTNTKDIKALMKGGTTVIVTSSAGHWEYPEGEVGDPYCDPGGECYDVTVVSGMEGGVTTIGNAEATHFEVIATNGIPFQVNPNDGTNTVINVTHLIQDKDAQGVKHLQLIP